MTNEITKSGSQLLTEQFAKKDLPGGIEGLNRWFDAAPTNRELYDALYEQVEVNVRIADAIVNAFGNDRDAQGASIQNLIRRLRAQTNDLGQYATRGVTRSIEDANNGNYHDG